MPYDQALAQRVKAALGGAPRVQEKRLFGGLAFMVRGKLCVSVGRNRIMCRIDPAIHDAALEREGCQTLVMKGREFRGYVRVDADVIQTKSELDHWIGLALDYNAKAKDATRKRR